MTHTRKAQIDSLLPTAPSVKVDTCGIRTADPCPLARTLPPLGRWSGSFSHGVSFLGRETKDQPFNSYRCHPQGVFTGPYLLRRPYHPQKPASQTLRLQGAPLTRERMSVGENSQLLARAPRGYFQYLRPRRERPRDRPFVFASGIAESGRWAPLPRIIQA